MANFSDGKNGVFCTCTREKCSDECRTYRKYRPRYKTNANHIRNMTDEQFANWLVEHVADSPWCKPDAPGDTETRRCQIWDCEKCALEWLRQEAKQCTK